jgi:hypothetical protein
MRWRLYSFCMFTRTHFHCCWGSWSTSPVPWPGSAVASAMCPRVSRPHASSSHQASALWRPSRASASAKTSRGTIYMLLRNWNMYWQCRTFHSDLLCWNAVNALLRIARFIATIFKIAQSSGYISLDFVSRICDYHWLNDFGLDTRLLMMRTGKNTSPTNANLWDLLTNQ